MQGNNYQVDKEPLMNVPLYKANQEESNKVSSIIDNILNVATSDDYAENKQKQQSVKKYGEQIDIIVYKFYELTYSEVKIIDPEFTLSEEEYDNYQI